MPKYKKGDRVVWMGVKGDLGPALVEDPVPDARGLIEIETDLCFASVEEKAVRPAGPDDEDMDWVGLTPRPRGAFDEPCVLCKGEGCAACDWSGREVGRECAEINK